jgi:hypothetical protein
VGGLPAYSTVGEWQGRGRVAAGWRKSRGRVVAGSWQGRKRQVMSELAFNAAGKRHGNGMVCVNWPLMELSGRVNTEMSRK